MKAKIQRNRSNEKGGDSMKRALLIEFDLHTGKRAGGINNKDPNLLCHGWQDLDSEPAREIRLVMDNRDMNQYKGMPGVTVLNGVAAINQAIDDVMPIQYKVTSEVLLAEHIRQRGISLDDYAGKSEKEIIVDLFNKGLVGIRKRPINKIKE